MDGQEDFSPVDVGKGLLKAQQKIIDNYLENFTGYNYDVRDIFLSYEHYFAKLFVDPLQVAKVDNDLFNFTMGSWNLLNRFWFNSTGDAAALVAPGEDDKRFSSPEWQKYPYFNFIEQNYLLAERFFAKVIDEVEMSEDRKKKLHFFAKQFSDLLSPSNYFFLNPQAIERAFKTNGQSVLNGFQNFLADLQKGKITQTTEQAFHVGVDLAITPGSVIFENELIQLIQYRASTDKVFETPLLMIPPWINKYYILDLRPEKSLVKYLVDKGHTVFMISWRNPTPDMGHLSFDDYVEKGTLSAIEAVRKICGVEKINALGYCLGGTLLGITSAILTTKKKKYINTCTFLAAMIDFADIGPMGAVVNKALVNKLSRGELKKEGVLHGHDMETAFNLIRANDLIWYYAINNYLLGQPPRPFDVIYWTNDNTNLPANMYLYYMEYMILGNRLSRKNALRILDTPVDVCSISEPVFIIAFKEDTISPPQTVFTTSELVSGEVEFILGDSGHVMGVANSPAKKKYGNYADGKLGRGFEEWKKSAVYSQDSWWLTWTEKLKKYSGNKIPSPKKEGNEKYKVVEPAPGSYVLQKC